MNQFEDKKNILFIISKKDNNPFNTLHPYLDKNIFYTIEIPSLKINDEQKFFSFYIYRNNKIIFKKKIKLNKIFGIFQYIFFSLKTIFQLRKYNKKKIDLIIFETLNNFLISLFYKIFNKNVKLIFFDGVVYEGEF